MRKHLVAIIVLSCSFSATKAQLFVSKLLGSGSSDYTKGWGAFYNVAFPVSQADAISAEIGFNVFFLKDDTKYGVITAPLKVGYLYTFDRSGSGFYAEPQLGYNITGVSPHWDQYHYNRVEDRFHGFGTTANLGYLVNWRSAGLQIKLGTRLESVFYGGGNVTSAGLMIMFNSKKFND